MKKSIKIFAIITVLFFGLCLFILSSHSGGWKTFIVQSGSMTPTIQVGSLVVTHYIHPTLLKKDDIITFLPPIKRREFVTHRIIHITQQNGFIKFKTQGDNNKTPDAWEIAGGSIVGKMVYTIPNVGYLLAFAQSKIGILIFILIPAIYIIVEEISVIINLLKNQHTEQGRQSTRILILFFIETFFYSSQPTFALLTDTTQLTKNYFTVSSSLPLPTATPYTHMLCNGNTTITINGNGVDSTNTVSVTNNCTNTIIQNKNAPVSNNIH